MWQTATGRVIFVKRGQLSPLIADLKKTHDLWLRAVRDTRGSIRMSVLRLLGRLVRQAGPARTERSVNGIPIWVHPTTFAGQTYDLLTRPSGALVGLRERAVDWEFEFEGEPGISANSIHEMLLTYYRNMLEAKGYEVRVNKQKGDMDGDSWKVDGATRLRPDLQVRDKTGKMFLVELDSKPASSRAHRDALRAAAPNIPLVLLTFNHKPGEDRFRTSFLPGHSPALPRDVLQIFQRARTKDWTELSLARSLYQAARAKRQQELAARRAAARRRPLSNKPPTASGTVRRTPTGGMHKEQEFLSPAPAWPGA